MTVGTQLEAMVPGSQRKRPKGFKIFGPRSAEKLGRIFGWKWLNHYSSITTGAGEKGGGRWRARFLAWWEVIWGVLKKRFERDRLGSTVIKSNHLPVPPTPDGPPTISHPPMATFRSIQRTSCLIMQGIKPPILGAIFLTLWAKVGKPCRL